MAKSSDDHDALIRLTGKVVRRWCAEGQFDIRRRNGSAAANLDLHGRSGKNLITVTSDYRCAVHNDRTAGSRNFTIGHQNVVCVEVPGSLAFGIAAGLD